MNTNKYSEQKKEIQKLHLRFATDRGVDKTYCPSEVAKAFRPKNWRNYMDVVRDVADDLVSNDKLVVMQNGIVISGTARMARGPIRLKCKK